MKKVSEKPNYPTLSKIFPIVFWKKCSKCNNSFVLEKGWHAVTGPYFNGGGVHRYLCTSCAPNKDAANNYFFSKSYLPKRPTRFPPSKKAVKR